jgi:hypothetical protein
MDNRHEPGGGQSSIREWGGLDRWPVWPGASDTEIKIGNTMPYSGPASSYGVIGKSEANRRPRSLSSRHDPWAYVRNVCFWHKADISRLSSNVRFWG